jgi:alanine-glyoxylate transaminase/serine-glyoxylate transaminase/serine-pyruvate transaminase
VVEFVPGDWRSGVDPAVVEAKLAEDRAACLQGRHGRPQRDVDGRDEPHSRDPPGHRPRGHPALFMVDTISSLASIDYRHDEWGVDVTGGRARRRASCCRRAYRSTRSATRRVAASKHAKLPRAYWRWDETITMNRQGYFPSTPATNLLYGLHEALAMLREEGMANVFARHQRHAEATRRAVRGWGLEILCRNPAEYSGSLTR